MTEDSRYISDFFLEHVLIPNAQEMFAGHWPFKNNIKILLLLISANSRVISFSGICSAFSLDAIYFQSVSKKNDFLTTSQMPTPAT
jgi:hypothetical protein